MNGSDIPFFDFAKDIGYESPRYYLPEFSMYRIMTETVQDDPNFSYGLNENGEYVRYDCWDLNPPRWNNSDWHAESVIFKVSGDIPNDFDISKKLRIRTKLSAEDREISGLEWIEWRSELEVQVAVPASSSITVNTPAANTGVEYHGVKIFDANKLDTGEATDICWYAPERYTPEDRASIYEILKLSPIDFANDDAFNADAQRAFV